MRLSIHSLLCARPPAVFLLRCNPATEPPSNPVAERPQQPPTTRRGARSPSGPVVLRCAGLFDSVNPDRAIKTSDGHISQVFERQTFSETQLDNHVRDQNLLGLRVGTQPCRQLHRRSEEIVLALDWLSCRSADPNLERMFGVLLLMLGPIHPLQLRAQPSSP